MITALSEFVDMLYTRATNEMIKPPAGIACDWDICLRPPQTLSGPMVVLSAKLHSEKAQPRWGKETRGSHHRTINTVCNFDSVERGHRVGPEELGVVADYYIRKMNDKLKEAWS